MNINNGLARGLMAHICLLALSSGFAQEPSATKDPRPVCPSLLATVIVSKPLCLGELCFSQPTQGGMAAIAAVARRPKHAFDSSQFSEQVAGMLSAGLKQTGCFDILASSDATETGRDPDASGKQASATQSADYIINAAVIKTEVSTDESRIVIYSKKTTTYAITIDMTIEIPGVGKGLAGGSYDATAVRSSSGVPGIFTSGNDSKEGTPFTDAAQSAITRAIAGITARIRSLPPRPAAQTPAAQPPSPAEPLTGASSPK